MPEIVSVCLFASYFAFNPSSAFLMLLNGTWTGLLLMSLFQNFPRGANSSVMCRSRSASAAINFCDICMLDLSAVRKS